MMISHRKEGWLSDSGTHNGANVHQTITNLGKGRKNPAIPDSQPALDNIQRMDACTELYVCNDELRPQKCRRYDRKKTLTDLCCWLHIPSGHLYHLCVHICVCVCVCVCVCAHLSGRKLVVLCIRKEKYIYYFH